MNAPPLTPAAKGPPPLPQSVRPIATVHRKTAMAACIFGVILFTAASVAIVFDDGNQFDFKIFSVGLALVTWVGLVGLIRRSKRFAWGAYVTCGLLLLGFPLGTVLGVFGIKAMNIIYPTFK